MRSSILFFIVILTLIAFSSCNLEKNYTSESVVGEVETLPEDYLTFYNTFHKDSIYQMNFTQWPLQGIQTSERDSNIINGRFYHKKENWLMHRHMEEKDGFSKITKIINTDLIEETLVDSKGQFGMKRRFAKIGRNWYLIYYSGINHIAH